MRVFICPEDQSSRRGLLRGCEKGKSADATVRLLVDCDVARVRLLLLLFVLVGWMALLDVFLGDAPRFKAAEARGLVESIAPAAAWAEGCAATGCRDREAASSGACPFVALVGVVALEE